MFRNFVDKIISVCLIKRTEEDIYNNITKILKYYKPEKLNEIIENEIYDNYDKNRIKIINNNNYPYYKYLLYSSELFDIVNIKWEKNSMSNIHDHPDKGCIMYVMNDGKLIENVYVNNNTIYRIGTNKLTYGKIGYRIGNKYLHKITADEFTETLHIYIPGNYKCIEYKKNHT
jgi:hypothetical protein